MSGQSTANKIAKAQKKAGDKLGFPYTVYLPVGNSNALGFENFIGSVNASFTQGGNYQADPQEFGVPLFRCYTDGSVACKGSFLQADNLMTTYVIVAAEPLKPRTALMCNTQIDISAVGYNIEGPTFSKIATNLPALGIHGSTGAGSLGVAMSGSGSKRTMTVITSLVGKPNLLNCAMRSGNFNGTITNVEYSPTSSLVKLTAQEA